jgi:dipeptidyl aminopeptidase/acylaminoacyl peptidase
MPDIVHAAAALCNVAAAATMIDPGVQTTNRKKGGGAVAGLACLLPALAMCAPLSLDALLGGARVQSVELSPDGRYLALLVVQDGEPVVAVVDRTGKSPSKEVLRRDSDQEYRPSWCHWANDTRLLCGYRGLTAIAGRFFPRSRLVAVDADGSNLKILLQYTAAENFQYQDRVIDWTPADPNSVLVELYEEHERTPSVFKMDVYSGKLTKNTGARPYIDFFLADSSGNVRLAWGIKDSTINYFARLQGGSEWKPLAHAEVYEDRDIYRPVSIVPGSDFAYAIRDQNGRAALWKIDLHGLKDPELIYENSSVDVSGPVLSETGELIGIGYETEKPEVQYLDERIAKMMRSLDLTFPKRQHRIISTSRDQSTFVVRAEGDTTPAQFLLVTVRDGKLEYRSIGSSMPSVRDEDLVPTKPIEFPARDGTWIPGYLTAPASVQKPPLIVLPHGGPYLRDTWRFDPWVQYLATRGYAVLQLNFRGSTGYGEAWFRAGFDDWSGFPYTDMIDGVQWAVERGYADGARVCVVGGSFGGYLALRAATTDPGLFRCAVSIAGVSDLPELKWDHREFLRWGQLMNKGVGKEPAKLKNDSPRNHAASMTVPLLMIHGTRDYIVPPDQTKMMAAALDRAGKTYSNVLIEGADHYFGEDTHQRQLLTELGKFVDSHLRAQVP